MIFYIVCFFVQLITGKDTHDLKKTRDESPVFFIHTVSRRYIVGQITQTV